MGSVAKHMNHPYDDLDLRIGDLLGMITGISDGRVAGVEKFDGINMHWTKSGDKQWVRFARNFGDVREGGMNLADMAGRYANHPARSQFVNGITAIWKTTKNIEWTMPTDATFWVNCEIIDTDHPQTIPYDSSAVVWHQLSEPNEQKNAMRRVVGSQNSAFVGMLKSALCASMVTNDEAWKTLGPSLLVLEDRSDADEVKAALTAVETIRDECGFTNTNTVGDIIRFKTRQFAQTISSDKYFIDAFVSLVMKDPGRKSIVALRKMVFLNESQKELINSVALAKNIPKWRNKCVKGLREMWLKFGAFMLEGVSSNLIDDEDAAKQYVKDVMDWAVIATEKDMQTTGNRKHWEELQGHLHDFESLNAEPPIVEGFVFLWHDKPYKMTGGFASMNRVVGVPRYGIGLQFDADELSTWKNEQK